MEQIKARPGRALQLGYAGEHQVRQIIFDLAPFAELGTGTAELVISLPDDDRRYPVRLEQDGTTATWTVGRGEVPTAGQGRAQLNYLVDGRVAKTEVWPTWVKPSLSATEETPPEAQQGWVDQVLAAGISAAKDAGRAEAAAKEAVDTAKGIKDISQQVQQVDRDAAAAKADAAKAKTQADRAADASHQTGLDRAAVEEAVAQLAPMAEQVSKDKAAAEGAAADAAGHAAAAKADADRAGAAALALIDDQVLSADHVLSSKRTADLLGDPFIVSGPVVTCQPVEGYPLEVTSRVNGSQAKLTICGRNLLGHLESGYLSTQDGSLISSITRSRTANFIRVMPNTKYYIRRKINDRIMWVIGYDDRFRGVNDSKENRAALGAAGRDETWYPFMTTPTTHYIKCYWTATASPEDFALYAVDIPEILPAMGDTYTVDFGREVQAGEYNWTTGELTITVPEPATVQLSPQIIPALPGINTLYADTGDVTVTGVRKTVGAPGPGPGPGPDQPVDPGALDQYVQQAKGHADRAEAAAAQANRDRQAVSEDMVHWQEMENHLDELGFQVQENALKAGLDSGNALRAKQGAEAAQNLAEQAATQTGQDRQAVAEAVAGLPAQIRQATEAAEQASADAAQTGKDKLAAEAARQGADSAKAAADQSAKTAEEQADKAAGDLAGHNADPAAHEDIRKAVSQLNESLGAYPVVEMSETTAELKPNVEYRWGEVASLTVTLGAEKPGITNEYRMRFISGSSPTVLSVPSTVRWITPLNVESGKTYEVSILNGLGVICGVTTA